MKKKKLEWSPVLEFLYRAAIVGLAISYVFYESGTEKEEIPGKNEPAWKVNKVPAVKPREPKKSGKRSAKQSCLVFSSIMALCFTLLYFTIGIAQISGSSMSPNFQNGEIFLYSRLNKTIEYGDVIVFQKDNQKYVKRVYGRPGDSISINDAGLVLVNNSPLVLDQLLLLGPTVPRDLKNGLTLGEDEYFVLGDNRPVSLDSRNSSFGAVRRDTIIGVYLLGIKFS